MFRKISKKITKANEISSEFLQEKYLRVLLLTDYDNFGISVRVIVA